MTGACVSMSLMKSLVILSNSSTSLKFSGTPPPGTGTGPGGDGCVRKQGEHLKNTFMLYKKYQHGCKMELRHTVDAGGVFID